MHLTKEENSCILPTWKVQKMNETLAISMCFDQKKSIRINARFPILLRGSLTIAISFLKHLTPSSKRLIVKMTHFDASIGTSRNEITVE